MSVNKEQEVMVTLAPIVRWGLLLALLIGFTLGLVVGQPLGERDEHKRICNSPQVPFRAPIAIPACK